MVHSAKTDMGSHKMRAWIAVILMAMTVTVWAGEQSKEVKRYEVALDAQELTDGVESLADLLENKLSGPAKDYYDVLVAKNKLYGKAGVGGSVLLILLATCFSILAARRAAKSQDSDDGLIALYVVLAFVYFMAAAVIFGTHVGLLLSPEYCAMKEFIRTARSFMP